MSAPSWLARSVLSTPIWFEGRQMRDEPQAWSEIEAERAVETGALGDRSL
jgi:hypothetical protein